MPLLAAAQAIQQTAKTPAEVFTSQSNNRWISRDISFTELGFTGPLILGAPDTRREIYLPVPANVPLSGAEMKLNSSYMRADGGRTSLVISLDTYPVSSRAFALEKGDSSIALGVDGSPRPSGFVRLGLNWGTALGAEWLCADGRTPGNVLRIEPDSRFSYRYDGSAIRDLTTAWGALPAVPVILISSNNLTSETYDSAWRVGLALERAGKHSKIAVLPSVGDTIDLQGFAVPSGLRGVPAFAAIAQGGKHKLKDAAELGALLALGQDGPFRADIVIADKAIAVAMKTAFDALAAQLQTSAPEAVPAFAQWRSSALSPEALGLAASEVRLAYMFGRPTIVLAADAGVKAAGLFGTYWNRLAVGSSMVVRTVDAPVGKSPEVSLKYLGGKPGSFDVLAHADWNAAFAIGAVAADGRIPGSLVLDLAAAPSAARTPPVVSIFMNDILLGAKQMDANGKPERITVPVPRYSLAANNILRLSFVRQLASDRCRETPEAYPVSVLPSSHMLLVKASPTQDFNGMVSRYADGAHVMVPAAFLGSSQSSLARMIRLAAVTGVSPLNARFTAVTGEVMPSPEAAFLAVELPFTELKSKVKTEGGRVTINTGTDSPMLDVTGLNQVGVAEVVSVGGQAGVVYRAVGSEALIMEKPILLGQGDVAVIGTAGLLGEINTSDPDARGVVGRDNKSWILSRGYWWLVPILLVVFMVALLVFASRIRRRRGND